MPIPIADENPTKLGHKSPITITIIVINMLVFFLYQIDLSTFFSNISGAEVSDASVLGFGLIPSVLWDVNFLEPQFHLIPAEATVLTHMFLHGGIMHLISNMLILWVFGDNIEQALGRYAYLAFYLIGGMVGGLLHAYMQDISDGPLIGASGAVSAVGAAYLLLHPRAKLWLLLFWIIPLKIPAWTAICAWFVYQVWATTQSGGEAIAWWAHIGGFGFGIGFIILFKRQLISSVFTKLFTKTAS